MRRNQAIGERKADPRRWFGVSRLVSWGRLALATTVDRKTTAEFPSAPAFGPRIIHARPIKIAFSGKINETKGLTTHYMK